MILNGPPKAGNHALWKAVELLGVPGHVNHLPHPLPEHEGPHIFIRRDPRNMIVSWLRFMQKPVTPGMFLTALQDFDGQPFVQMMAGYEPYLSDGVTQVIRYEPLISNPLTMMALADYLGVSYIDGAWEQLPGHTKTWNAEHSDYRPIWTEEVAERWVKIGGDELLNRWGY